MKLEWACIIRAPSEGDQRCLVSDLVLTLEFKDSSLRLPGVSGRLPDDDGPESYLVPP